MNDGCLNWQVFHIFRSNSTISCPIKIYTKIHLFCNLRYVFGSTTGSASKHNLFRKSVKLFDGFTIWQLPVKFTHALHMIAFMFCLCFCCATVLTEKFCLPIIKNNFMGVHTLVLIMELTVTLSLLFAIVYFFPIWFHLFLRKILADAIQVSTRIFAILYACGGMLM